MTVSWMAIRTGARVILCERMAFAGAVLQPAARDWHRVRAAALCSTVVS